MPTGKAPPNTGDPLVQDVVSAAFALEAALFPGRCGSSTVAVNRNAAFLPHTDSGAGAGQSRSLIVALGDFHGRRVGC